MRTVFLFLMLMPGLVFAAGVAPMETGEVLLITPIAYNYNEYPRTLIQTSKGIYTVQGTPSAMIYDRTYIIPAGRESKWSFCIEHKVDKTVFCGPIEWETPK